MSCLRYLWKLALEKIVRRAELCLERINHYDKVLIFKVKSMVVHSNVIDKHHLLQKKLHMNHTSYDCQQPYDESLDISHSTSTLTSVNKHEPSFQMDNATPLIKDRSKLPQMIRHSFSPFLNIPKLPLFKSSHSLINLERNKSSSVAHDTDQNTLKFLLDQEIISEIYQATFNLPESEKLLTQQENIYIMGNCCSLIQKRNYVKGSLYLSPLFLCYSSCSLSNSQRYEKLNYSGWKNDPDFFYLIIPLATIQNIHIKPIENYPRLKGILVNTHISGLFFVSKNTFIFKAIRSAIACLIPSKNMSMLSNLSVTSKQNSHHDILSKNQQDKKYIWTEQFCPSYSLRQESGISKWMNYFQEHGIGISFIRSAELKILIGEGIPDALRGPMWKILSGGLSNALADSKTYEEYQQEAYILYRKKEFISPERKSSDNHMSKNEITSLARRNGKDSSYRLSKMRLLIELDARRAMPDHPYYQTEEGVEALRNVLLTIACKNPEVAYCQGMNMVASVLLLYLNEAETFWVIDHVCKHILSRVWRPYMLDLKIIKKTIRKALEQELNKRKGSDLCNVNLYKLDNCVELIMVNWIPRLCVGALPLQYALMMIDNVFFHGIKAIIAIIYTVVQEWISPSSIQLLTEDKAAIWLAACEKIESFPTNWDELLSKALYGDISIQHEQWQEWLIQSEVEVLMELRDQSIKYELDKLTENSTWKSDHLQILHSMYYSHIETRDQILMNRREFQVSLANPLFWFCQISQTKNQDDMILKLMALFDKIDVNGDEHVSIMEWTCIFEPIYHGSFEKQYQFFLDLISMNDGDITRSNHQKSLEMFLKMYQRELDKEGDNRDEINKGWDSEIDMSCLIKSWIDNVEDRLRVLSHSDSHSRLPPSSIDHIETPVLSVVGILQVSFEKDRRPSFNQYFNLNPTVFTEKCRRAFESCLRLHSNL